MVFMNLLYSKEMIHDGGGFDSLKTMLLHQSRHTFSSVFLHPFSETVHCEIILTFLRNNSHP